MWCSSRLETSIRLNAEGCINPKLIGPVQRGRSGPFAGWFREDGPGDSLVPAVQIIGAPVVKTGQSTVGKSSFSIVLTSLPQLIH